MKAIEFATASHNGVIHIPQEYKGWFSQTVRVILLYDADAGHPPEATETPNLSRFFDQFNADLSDYHFDREEANAR